MKVQDILKEVWDDDEDQKQFENPLPFDEGKLEDAWEYMDDVDGELARAYKTEHNIEEFPSGRDYGNALRSQRKKYGVVVDIPLDKIIPTEQYLYKDQIDNIIKGGNVKSSSELPILYKMGDGYFVGDGNHRIAAVAISGGKSIKTLVLDPEKINIKNKE